MTTENQRGEKGSPFTPLSRMISDERFSTYLTAAGHDEERALRLYRWNAAMGGAFHVPIQAVEVGLRNAVEHALSAEFGQDWWRARGFLRTVEQDQGAAVGAALRWIEKRGATPSTGRVVAGLSFGFWVAMLKPRYNPALWSRRLTTAFPDLPHGKSRAILAEKARAVAVLRNRIAHHEPIIGRNTSQDYADAMTLLRWMSPVMHDWVKAGCDVPELMRRKP